MADSLDLAFESGLLSHPLRGKTNSVELFRAVALLSGAPKIRPTTALDELRGLIGHHDHYFFVLVDGLGMNLKSVFPKGGFLETSFQTEIRSVFPSTTAVALTSLATGLWPAQHGLTGWWTHFPEYRRVIAPLIFRERGTGVRAEKLGLAVEDLIAGSPWVGGFFRDPASFLPVGITGSYYDEWSRAGTRLHAFRSHSHLERLVRRDARRLRGPSYRYLYLLTVDHLCHRHGVTSEEVADNVRSVDRLLTRLRNILPDRVRMIVTADHGLVDVPPEHLYTIGDSDALAQHVLGGQSGEGRAPVFHVKPGHEDAFMDAFAASDAAASFTLHRPADLAERGLYGPEPLSEPAVTHLGDFVGISTIPARLEYVPDGAGPVPHVGVHGGLLPDEINVPLCIA